MKQKLMLMLYENDCLNVYGKGISVKTYCSDNSIKYGKMYFSLYVINGEESIDETINVENCINIIMAAFKENHRRITSYDSDDVEISYQVYP